MLLRNLSKVFLSIALVTGIAEASVFSDQEAGEKFFQMVQQQLPLVSDAIVNDYIQNLGYRLVSYSDAPTHPFHFFVIQQDVINAFAGPGGYVGVFGGLIDVTQTESELASVMAHEISHVTQDHLQRGEDKTKNLTLPALAAMVAAIATGNGAVAMGGISSVAAGGIQYQINNTRVFEEEADAMGIQVLAKAGFNPYAMANFFKRLLEESRYDSTPIPMLMDHPVTQERIALAEERAKPLATKKDYPSSTTYYLAKARMQYLLAKDAKNFLDQTTASYQKDPNNTYQRYLLALAQFKNRQYAASNDLIKKLMQSDPDEVIYPYTLAQAAFLQKKYSEATRYIQQAYNLNSDYYPTVIFYGLILLRDHHPADAVKLLEQYQVAFSDSPDFWVLLSKSYADNHNLIYAYLSRAKAYLALNDLRNAVIQVTIAGQQPGQTAYTRSLIEAEKTRLQKQLRADKK
ncbi:MAG: M48 family metalloprotease [Pseudomonadota bacterium]